MIAVIADDFTGAAEIAGIGLRYGLKTAIRSSASRSADVDLLVINSDTRSQTVVAASRHIRKIAGAMRNFHPAFLYKKTDSVLRGHILAELAVQMEIMELPRALIVPSNPAFGRIINEGIYYINGTPLHQTGFGNDPEFAAGSSYVPDILRRTGQPPVVMGTLDKPLPSQGFVVGEAGSEQDLIKWAEKVDESTLAAGASGFFAALLRQRGFSPGGSDSGGGSGSGSEQSPLSWGNKKLFVCGSSFSASKHLVQDMAERGLPVYLLPPELTVAGVKSPQSIEGSVLVLADLISRHDYAVLSVGSLDADKARARTIREHMALITGQLTKQSQINELFLEGGATATAVLNEMRHDQLFPEQEIAHGVLRMRVPENREQFITVKPGSYPWPPAIRNLLR